MIINKINSFYSPQKTSSPKNLCFGKANNYINTSNEYYKRLDRLFSQHMPIEKGYVSYLYQNKKIDNDELILLMEKYADQLPFSDIEYFGRNRIPLTKYDYPEILRNRKLCVAKTFVETNSDEYKDNLDKILKSNFKKLENIPQKKQMLIVTGLPGSGKNTLIKRYFHQYFLADIDEIKKMFPSYETKARFDNSLHKVAKNILQQHILPEAIIQGRNVAIPTTGYGKSILEIAKPAKENDYNVKILHVIVSPDNAMKRTVKRYEETGNFVDPFFVLKRAPYLDKQLKEIENSSYIDEIKYTTN